VAEVARLAHCNSAALDGADSPPLAATARYEPPPLSLSNATHACAVEVDIDTGKVEIQRYVVVEDCGIMLNPLIVDGQIAGGVAQGIGGVLYEQIAYDECGNLLTDTLRDYLLPTAVEIPELEIIHLATASPATPYGVKPMGEGGVMGAVPALLNAVTDALGPFGVRATDQPLSPSRVRQLLRNAGRQAKGG
jgi:carbon-monoxide dehydrogenase large subunit